MQPKIIFEDQDILVLNKPAGVVVNSAESVRGETLQAWMAARMAKNFKLENPNWQELIPADFDNSYGTPEEIFKQRQGMVHRLDKDTSGVLVFAKNPGALVSLLKSFRQREVSKSYLCLAHGKFKESRGEVDAPIKRNPKNPQKFSVSSDGRPALTKYEVQNFYKNFNEVKLIELVGQKKAQEILSNKIYDGFSFVECWPKTGRTHQIRVHFQWLKHPLVADKKYVGRKRFRVDELWCLRQFLHAYRIKFIHPKTHKRVEFLAPLPKDLKQALGPLVPSKK